MTLEERESVLQAATPRPWHRADGDLVGPEGQWVDLGSRANLDSPDERLAVYAVNEHEAHLDGERLLRGVLDYFRGYDDEREDGRTSPVIPKIEAVLARLDAARTA